MLEAILDSLAHILIAVVIFFCFLLLVTWVVRQLTCTSDRKRLQNAKEKKCLSLVQVGKKRLSISLLGNRAKQTPKLVLLSGTGTPSPLLDFTALIEELQDFCCLIVVEKSG